MSKTITKEEGYLPNREFVQEVIECQKKGEISDRLARMFMLLSEKVSTHRFFIRYPFKEDLISEGVLACVAAFDKFDPEYISEKGGEPNAHSFFTTVCFNAYRAYIGKYYKQKNIKDSLMVDNNLNPSYGYADAIDGDGYDE